MASRIGIRIESSRTGVECAERDEQAGDCSGSCELRARGAFAWAGGRCGSGIAVHGDGMRGRSVSEHVATAGISDYHARRGADGAYCYVSLGDSRLVGGRIGSFCFLRGVVLFGWIASMSDFGIDVR